jgi:PAS domain-containing protein
VDIGDLARGSIWFVWATMVTVFRFATIVAYRHREPGSDPEPWGRLVIAANLLAGIQWGALGALLFPASSGYAQIFIVMTITCFVGGSLTAYGAVRGAHEALAIPATVPTAINLFFIQDGTHWFAGVTALFFCFAIAYYAKKLNRHIVNSFRLQIERDDLLALTAQLNEKLQQENRDLAHRAAVRGISVEAARERAGRLETLFENSPLPQLECDAAGFIITCNRATERLLGLRYEDIVGRALSSFLAGRYASGKALAGCTRAAECGDRGARPARHPARLHRELHPASRPRRHQARLRADPVRSRASRGSKINPGRTRNSSPELRVRPGFCFSPCLPQTPFPARSPRTSRASPRCSPRSRSARGRGGRRIASAPSSRS